MAQTRLHGVRRRHDALLFSVQHIQRLSVQAVEVLKSSDFGIHGFPPFSVSGPLLARLPALLPHALGQIVRS